MKRTLIKHVLSSGNVNDEVLVQGWVKTRRDNKGFSFVEVNDGSCFGNVQVVVESSLAGYDVNVLAAATGASVTVRGILVSSPGKEQSTEIKAVEFKLVGDNGGEEYPLQKKRHSNEFLRTIGHLRPRTNTFGAVFRIRSVCAYAIHKFFNERSFVYLHSPIITASDCEGAGTMFQVTTLNLEEAAAKGKVNYAEDFFEKKASLTVSGQLEGETFACALSNIYTFGPTFRAENSNTPRHLAEFWMIEPEMAFCDLRGDMEVAEAFIKYVISYVLENCADDMKFCNQWVEKGIIDSLTKVVTADFGHLTYTEAIAALEKSGEQFEFPVHWGMDIQTEHEKWLTEKHVGRPVFVTNYPKEIKAFYMRLDEGEKTVSAMDLLVPRLGEIIGGSQREERYDVLKRRIEECHLNIDEYWWYMDLRRYGSVPHAGFGLGFERMIMYLTGMTNIRDVIPYPRTPGNIAF
ncbi:MAG: asparagine--tRNA ligase [Deltaproteobacteria bacterium]|nr:asparagine--tRNA ligase [Deltaproteobacteria bacterium]